MSKGNGRYGSAFGMEKEKPDMTTVFDSRFLERVGNKRLPGFPHALCKTRERFVVAMRQKAPFAEVYHLEMAAGLRHKLFLKNRFSCLKSAAVHAIIILGYYCNCGIHTMTKVGIG